MSLLSSHLISPWSFCSCSCSSTELTDEGDNDVSCGEKYDLHIILGHCHLLFRQSIKTMPFSFALLSRKSFP